MVFWWWVCFCGGLVLVGCFNGCYCLVFVTCWSLMLGIGLAFGGVSGFRLSMCGVWLAVRLCCLTTFTGLLIASTFVLWFVDLRLTFSVWL